GDELPRVTEYRELAAVEDAVVQREHRGTEVVLDRLQAGSEGREDNAVAPRDGELAQPVLGRIEVCGHAALLLHAAPERNADQITLQVVCPLVIRAHELGDVAEVALAELHAAVCAAV